jgi:hypothetical protein
MLPPPPSAFGYPCSAFILTSLLSFSFIFPPSFFFYCIFPSFSHPLFNIFPLKDIWLICSGKSDIEQWHASNLLPVNLTEVFNAIPISKTAKKKVNKILNYFNQYFLADPKVCSYSGNCEYYYVLPFC